MTKCCDERVHCGDWPSQCMCGLWICDCEYCIERCMCTYCEDCDVLIEEYVNSDDDIITKCSDCGREYKARKSDDRAAINAYRYGV